MAVIDNVEVSISSRHHDLQEFPVPIDDEAWGDYSDHPSCTKIVKRYIEAVPGANFEINYSIKTGQTYGCADYLSFNTWVDGQRVLAPVVEPHRLLHRDWSVSRQGSRSGIGSKWVIQPYTWALLLSTDETTNATIDDIKARYGKIGSIRVEFSRKKRLGVTRQFEPVSLNEDPVPEKAIKEGQGLDLGVGLQHPRPRDYPVNVHHGEIIDDGPLAAFTFLYRSKNALQILGVLPRAPEPKPLEERDPATLSRAEMLQLIRQQQAELGAMRAKVEKEKAEPDMRRFGTIEREATDDKDNMTVAQLPRKRVRKEAKVIDLTHD
ncbi:hypothetical protein PV04_06143 [Phialophora macrospora]|uniref:DUF7918 domain-containing protein n=1 Tax=Phialophora macrospora TaxID=1851006 RepID=A0A0D2CNQ6_9EURO|nr:hypothetical protein PV04_06143 [Phialophora macrospora]